MALLSPKYDTGGSESPFIAYLGILPIISIGVVNLPCGILWVIISLVEGLYFFADLGGSLPHSVLKHQELIPLFSAICYGLSICICFISIAAQKHWLQLYALRTIRTNSKIKQLLKYRTIQNKKLEELNQFLLSKSNDMYFTINDLENILKEKNQLIENKKRKLEEYSFLNSHVIRSPVARILGLSTLLGITTDPEELQKIKNLIVLTGREIDEVLHKSSEIITWDSEHTMDES